MNKGSRRLGHRLVFTVTDVAKEINGAVSYTHLTLPTIYSV